VVRALEVWEITGRPISAWQLQWKPSDEFRIEDRESKLKEDPGSSFEDGGLRIEDRELDIASPSSILHPPSSSRFPPSSILHRCLWLDTPREELYARINDRVRRMIAEGWLEEAARLRQLERPLSREAAQALGCQELFAYLDGQANLEETIERIQIRSRHFAKRQISWFRHLPECRPVPRELTFNLWGLTMK